MRDALKTRLPLIMTAYKEGLGRKNVTAFWLLSVLASLVDSGGYSSIAVELLGGPFHGVSRRTIHRALRELVSGGYIAVAKGQYFFGNKLEWESFDGGAMVTAWCRRF